MVMTIWTVPDGSVGQRPIRTSLENPGIWIVDQRLTGTSLENPGIWIVDQRPTGTSLKNSRMRAVVGISLEVTENNLLKCLQI